MGPLDISFTVYLFVFQYPSVPSLNCPPKRAKKSRPAKEDKRSAANIGSIL